MFAAFGTDGTSTGQSTASSAPTARHNSDAPAAPRKENGISVTAGEITANYAANEARGDSLYKGKVVRVKGVGVQITKDIVDDTVVELRDPSMVALVQSTMSSDAEQFAINLQQGQTVV